MKELYYYRQYECSMFSEEFNKPKIVWNRIASVKQFALDNAGILIQDSMHFIVGENLNYLCSVLNSKVIQWLLQAIIGEAAGGNSGNADNVWKLKIPVPIHNKKIVDEELYQIISLSDEEISFIQSQQNQ